MSVQFSCLRRTTAAVDNKTQGKGEMKADEQKEPTEARFRQNQESNTAALSAADACAGFVHRIYLLALPAHHRILFCADRQEG